MAIDRERVREKVSIERGSREMDVVKAALAETVCYKIDCPDYGKVGQGNMRTRRPERQGSAAL